MYASKIGTHVLGNVTVKVNAIGEILCASGNSRRVLPSSRTCALRHDTNVIGRAHHTRDNATNIHSTEITPAVNYSLTLFHNSDNGKKGTLALGIGCKARCSLVSPRNTYSTVDEEGLGYPTHSEKVPIALR